MSKQYILSQIVVLYKTIKAKVHSETSDLYKLMQKPDLFLGLSREYKPINDEDTERLPAESKKIQFTAKQLIISTCKQLAEYFTISARREWTNTAAFADIIVDDNVLISKVPVGYLMFLEKQLVDLKTMIAALPVLDSAENWDKDANGTWRSKELMTHRTKKTSRAIVKYPATSEHPAQTEMVTEDIIAGHWHITKLSGALAQPERDEMIDKLEKIRFAVKTAREMANTTKEVESPDVSKILFDYIFDETI
jgi:hypothetical protein